MPRVARRLLTITAASSLLLVAGCGGDDKKDSTSTNSSGAAARGYDQTIADAGAICTKVTADVGAAVAKEDWTGAAKAGNDGLAELKKIVPDPKLADSYNAMTDAITQAQEAADQAFTANAGGDEAEYQRIIEDSRPLFDEANALARKAGIPACAE